ncbi:MAG TPA: glycosyltransferase family 39 protein, partial [Caldilineae bacterium]|nr:glycosyltransferase family 39 protein [Caldilineae bacterium]
MRRTWAIAAAIILLALLCRLPWALQPRTVRWDEPDFLILARHVLRGEGYQVFGVPELIWPPGAPAFAAISLAVGVPIEQALALWHAVAGALACGLLYGLSREVTGDGRVAAIAGLLAATSPALAVRPLYWGSLTESIFLAFWLTGLWATWRLLNGERWPAGLTAGVAFAVAYLTRPEGLIWWGGFLVLGVGLAVWRRKGWRALSCYALSFLILIAPYLFYLYHHTGRLMLSGKLGITIVLGMRVTELGSGLGHDYAAALDSTGKEIIWLSPERFEISLWDVIRADPRGALRRLRRNLFRAWNILPDPLLGLAVIGLIGLGLWGRPWDRRRWIREGFLFAAIAPLGIVPFFHVQPRLLVPLIPIVLIWAARGVLHVASWAD